LLQLLGVNKNLRLLSTVSPVPEGTLMFQGMGMYEMIADGTTQNVKFFPSLDQAVSAWEARFSDWWEQIVYVVPPKIHNEQARTYRRKDIILTVVNKEGGAHVDA
jgi:hypothetical protein